MVKPTLCLDYLKKAKLNLNGRQYECFSDYGFCDKTFVSLFTTIYKITNSVANAGLYEFNELIKLYNPYANGTLYMDYG